MSMHGTYARTRFSNRELQAPLASLEAPNEPIQRHKTLDSMRLRHPATFGTLSESANTVYRWRARFPSETLRDAHEA